MADFTVRKAQPKDLERILVIYAKARAFMTKNGNPRQWALKNWPPIELVKKDIEDENCYVVEYNFIIEAVFVYLEGYKIEKTYEKIEGSWIGGDTYAVVHRIASSGNVKGVGAFILSYAYDKSHHLRIDTHKDNVIMQNLLRKLDFTECGIIYVAEDNDPRIAYEKISK